MANIGYVGRQPNDTSVVIAEEQYNSLLGGETEFIFVAGYDIGYIDVYKNGLRLREAIDFTATDGRNINLVSAASAGDNIEIIAYKSFNPNQSITTIDASFAKIGVKDNGTVVGTGVTLNFLGIGNTFSISEFPHGNTINLKLNNYADSADYARVAGISTVTEGIVGQPNILVKDIQAEDINASNADFTGVVTATSFVGNVTGDVSGNAGSVTNGVYTTGNQTIGGTKTFSSTISGSIDGNAATASNASQLGGVSPSGYLRSNANDEATGQITLSGGVSTNGKDFYSNNGAFIVSDTGGPFSNRTGTNIDHIWHDDTGTGTWHFCSDSSYKGVGNSKIRSGSAEVKANADIATVNVDTINLARAGSTRGKITCTTNATNETFIIERAALKNYAEIKVNIGNTGSSRQLNLNSGNTFVATLNANCTFSFAQDLSSTGDTSFGFMLHLTNSGSGRSIVWPTSVSWPGGSVPSRNTVNGKTDIWSFFSVDGGSTWMGNLTISSY